MSVNLDPQAPSQPTPWRRPLKIAWILLLVVAAFPVLAAVADLASVTSTGLPSDHLPAFAQITGTAWQSLRVSAPGVARYISLLEVAYAVHELVFGILFLAIVAIPFRSRQAWAWWASWVVLLADIGYSLTFARQDAVLLRRSLLVDITLPVLLLIQLPGFLGGRHRT